MSQRIVIIIVMKMYIKQCCRRPPHYHHQYHPYHHHHHHYHLARKGWLIPACRGRETRFCGAIDDFGCNLQEADDKGVDDIASILAASPHFYVNPLPPIHTHTQQQQNFHLSTEELLYSFLRLFGQDQRRATGYNSVMAEKGS